MTCPKCNEAMVYKNQDYVSHGWYCKCGHNERCNQSCCHAFLIINRDEAIRSKVVDERLVYRNTCQVIVSINGGVLTLVGYDGGEPEDQLLCRDFKWVLPALNAAWEAGYKQGRQHKGSEER